MNFLKPENPMFSKIYPCVYVLCSACQSHPLCLHSTFPGTLSRLLTTETQHYFNAVSFSCGLLYDWITLPIGLVQIWNYIISATVPSLKEWHVFIAILRKYQHTKKSHIFFSNNSFVNKYLNGTLITLM